MLNKQDLTLDEMMVFSSEMRASEKSTALAYLMLLGGHLGIHRFYLNKKGTGILQLVLFLLACLFYFGLSIGSAAQSEALIAISIILFILPALTLFIWVIVDLFLLPRMLREYNARVEQEILREIQQHRQMKHLAGASRPDNDM
ncbi:TM2 domain-containing protein [Paenibacillus ginsengihumi]|uniref:TM2 domain-containing protein n=1 Tax=Paenibacillus ginsengihumi TaxID=431596 RepID=UPI0003707782|nr:TM2 domain-containing protein [Paenibacillus ginsengihumi]